jgi:hypothetical protein
MNLIVRQNDCICYRNYKECNETKNLLCIVAFKILILCILYIFLFKKKQDYAFEVKLEPVQKNIQKYNLMEEIYGRKWFKLEEKYSDFNHCTVGKN